jgi:FKBP-type peptidyl-prolyl cis-trans isomerase
MNKTTSVALFVIIAIAVIWGGVWYSGKMSREDRQAQLAAAAVATQPTATSGVVTQQINQPTNMTNLNLTMTNDVVGTGAEAKKGDTVSVLYTGTLTDGTVFDASSKHNNQPFSFTLGAGQVIEGWDIGVVGMKVGGKRELTIPPELGYGARGAGNTIPPNATLHFSIELLSVGTSTSQ